MPIAMTTAPTMTLEDHLGDILRKARQMSRVSANQAAAAAGLSEAELAALEESGEVKTPRNFEALAALLGLNAAKLASVAQGWKPSPKDLSAWRELRTFNTTEGGMSVHSYLVWDEATRAAAVFDTGWNPTAILETVVHEKLHLNHIFITHSHHDHVAALGILRAAYPKTRVHCNIKNAPMDQRNKPNECIHLGGLRITHRDTPGHAEDGVTYLVGNWSEDAPHVAFVGDAIFAGSMGGAADHGALAREKVRDQILTLPDDTLLCPGHGPLTTVREEKAHNPFF